MRPKVKPSPAPGRREVGEDGPRARQGRKAERSRRGERRAAFKWPHREPDWRGGETERRAWGQPHPRGRDSRGAGGLRDSPDGERSGEGNRF